MGKGINAQDDGYDFRIKLNHLTIRPNDKGIDLVIRFSEEPSKTSTNANRGEV